MSRLPRLIGSEVVRALQKADFEIVRQRGSHIYMKHSDGRATVVPVHKGEDLGSGILSKILRDVQLTRHEFRELL